MWLSVNVDAAEEKWERRRAARRAAHRERAASVPDPRSDTVPPPGVVFRPRCLDRAFILWMIIGVPLVLALVGILIIVAAFDMRAGNRSGRIWLTVLGSPSFISGPVFLVLAIVSAIRGDPVGILVSLVYIVLAAVVITGVVLTWRPEANQFYRDVLAVRRGGVDVR